MMPNFTNYFRRARQMMVAIFLLVQMLSQFTFAQPLAGTDDLGRTLPQNATVGKPKTGKQVVMFYYLWQGNYQTSPAFEGAVEPAKIVEQHPEVLHDYNSPNWGHTKYYYWGKSIYGYYSASDYWVHLKNVQLLADAGVDILILDYSNAVLYAEETDALMKALDAVQAQGKKAPKIVFYVITKPGATAQKIYDLFYKPDAPYYHPDTWYYAEGKPLIVTLSKPDHVKYSSYNFFSYRENWPWITRPGDAQTVNTYEGKNEIINVSAAQNGLFSDDAFYQKTSCQGRSYRQGSRGNPPADTPYGYNFQEQWDNALSKDLPFIFVTQWNEWITGRWTDTRFTNRSVFNDEATAEFSRDIEPSLTGNLKDNYYMQLVANIRRYKGIDSCQSLGLPKTINNMGDWSSVTQVYSDYTGDTRDRNNASGVVKENGNLTVSNNSFEEPVMTNNAKWQYSPQGASWSFYGKCGIINNEAAAAPNTSYGNQAAFLERDSFFSQDVNFDKPGKYFISFTARTNVPGFSDLKLYTPDNQIIDEMAFGDSVSVDLTTRWTKHSYVFNVLTAGSRNISFLCTSGVAYVDDVSVKHLDPIVYTNTTGRNDFDKLKVAYDANNFYFYAQTVAPVTAQSGDNWMNLYLDTDRFFTTGWKGYDYRIVSGERLQKWDSNVWIDVGVIDYTVDGNKMYLTIPISVLYPQGLTSNKFDLEFKWSDNMQDQTNPLDWYVNGDAAPGARFNFIATNLREADQKVEGFGNFENPALADATFKYKPATAVDDWKFYADAGIARNGSAFSNPTAPEGKQCAFLQRQGGMTKYLYLEGGIYKIVYSAANREKHGGQEIMITCDNGMVGYQRPDYNRFSYYSSRTFSVSAGIHKISFEGLISVADVTAFIDDVDIVPSTEWGGFESPALPAANFQYNDILSSRNCDWIFQSGSGIANNGSIFNNPIAPEGVQCAFLQGKGDGFYQDFYLASGVYKIRFKAAKRLSNSQAIIVAVDNTSIGGLTTPTSSSFASYSTSLFTIGEGIHRIKFSGVKTTDQTAFIDQVEIVLRSELAPGGFEAPALEANNYVYNPTSDTDGWTYSAQTGGSGVARNGSAFNNPNAPEGSQVAFIQTTGSMEKSFSFLNSGWHTIGFNASQRPNPYYPGNQTLKIFCDGKLIGIITPSTRDFQSYSSFVFNTSRGNHRIKLVGQNAAEDATAFVDDVKVVAVTQAPGDDTGFETPVLAGGSAYEYLGNNAVFAPDGWAYNGQISNGSGIARNGSAFNNPNAPEGSQVAFLQKNGAIGKNFHFAEKGWYKIAFMSSQRPSRSANQRLNIYCDNRLIGVVTPATKDFQSYSSDAFNVTAGPHQIMFAGQNSSEDATAFIDDVKIIPFVGEYLLGGFESPALPANYWRYNPVFHTQGWYFDRNATQYYGSGIAHNGSALNNPTAPEGSQVAFIENTATIVREVEITEAGSYSIEFKASQQPGMPGDQTLKITVLSAPVAGEQSVSTVIPTTRDFQAYASNSFTATPGVYVIGFAGQSKYATAFVDDVRLVFQGSQSGGGSATRTSTSSLAGQVTTADAEEPGKEISLYPNPVADVLNIECAHANPTIDLYDLNGVFISSRRFTGNKVSVDVKPLRDGMYVAKITEGNRVSYKKFVVARN